MNLRNLGACLQERFAPVNMGLFVVLFGTVRGVASLAGAANCCPPPAGGPALVALGALATIALFFHLRAFDEEKDFAQDARHHPQRVLQTGRVTLPPLRTLAWAGAPLASVLPALALRKLAQVARQDFLEPSPQLRARLRPHCAKQWPCG
ncbi:MAG: hypothetical protein ACRYG7_16235 [Janthinobacterium lividum]